MKKYKFCLNIKSSKLQLNQWKIKKKFSFDKSHAKIVKKITRIQSINFESQSLVFSKDTVLPVLYLTMVKGDCILVIENNKKTRGGIILCILSIKKLVFHVELVKELVQ